MIIKKKAIIFGAGTLGKDIFDKICPPHDVICYWDNYRTGSLNGVPICMPKSDVDFDIVYLASTHKEMYNQLLDLGIPDSKIDKYFIEHPYIVRNKWLENYKELLVNLNCEGALCEAGVYKGNFASYINSIFPDDVLYLFDTFEGFDSKDIDIEESNSYSCAEIGQFSDTSAEFVMGRMPNPQNVIIVKGYFPDSAKKRNINERFKFVNLDMDLYKPTLDGLRFFSNKMVRNGVILVHDYFTHYEGIHEAVHEFLKERNDLRLIPIGDEMSIAITGF